MILQQNELFKYLEWRRWVFEMFNMKDYRTVRELAQLLAQELGRHYGIEVRIVLPPTKGP